MSSKVLQHRRGTSEQHASFIGAEGEFTYNTTEKTIHVHDGSTSGGIALAKKEYVDSTKTSLESQISSITSKYITKATADASYLGKTEKAVSATTADSATKATQDGSGNTITSTYVTKATADASYLGKTAKASSATTADSATKATQDGSGNTITSTYATKSELSAVETTANSAVKKVNGQTPDSSGNVVVDVPPSIHVGTSAPSDSDIEVWIDTDENQGSAVLTVNNIAPDSNGNVNVDTSAFLTKTTADSTYLGKTEKASSATTADSATKATQDGSGNTITSTYATKSELSAIETVANGVVKKVNGIAPGTDGNVVVDIPTGVHVGNDAPTDADTSVWIDPDDATPVIDTTIFVQKSSIISSTEDLTAGTSALATGSIYLMYE